MDTALVILGWTGFVVTVLVGIALNAIGLFGNWLILGAIAAAWVLSDFAYFGPWALAIGLVLAILGEVLEAMAASYGAARFGGSRDKKAMFLVIVGCILGGIFGTPWFPIVGTLAGACLGAFLAATLYEYVVMEKQAGPSMHVGIGAVLGRVGGLFAKMFMGFAILAVAIVFLFIRS